MKTGMSRQKKRTRMRIVLIASVIVGLTSSARADIAPMRLVGGTSIRPMKPGETKVSMKHEVIRLRLSPEFCKVNVVFTMSNESDKYETMDVGFPANYKGELVDFKARINNWPVVVSDKTTSITSERGPEGLFSRTFYTYWKSWKMRFPPKKDTQVEVSYTTKFVPIYGRYFGSLHVGSAIAGTDLSKPELADLRQKFQHRSFRYILRTGAPWHQKIGTCRVEMSFDRLTPDHVALRFRPDASSKITAKDSLTWEWTNLEPKQDLYFQLTPNSTRKDREAIFDGLYQRFPDSPQVATVLASYLDKRGARDEAAKIQSRLLKTWADRIEIWGPTKLKPETLTQSRRVWRLAMELSASSEIIPNDGEVKVKKSLEPSAIVPLISRLADRVESQLKYAEPKSSVADYYRRQIKEMRNWCAEHSKKAAVPGR